MVSKHKLYRHPDAEYTAAPWVVTVTLPPSMKNLAEKCHTIVKKTIIPSSSNESEIQSEVRKIKADILSVTKSNPTFKVTYHGDPSISVKNVNTHPFSTQDYSASLRNRNLRVPPDLVRFDPRAIFHFNDLRSQTIKESLNVCQTNACGGKCRVAGQEDPSLKIYLQFYKQIFRQTYPQLEALLKTKKFSEASQLIEQSLHMPYHLPPGISPDQFSACPCQYSLGIKLVQILPPGSLHPLERAYIMLRVMAANLAAPYPSSRAPYVRLTISTDSNPASTFYTAEGKPGSDLSAETHIPLSEFNLSKMMETIQQSDPYTLSVEEEKSNKQKIK
jgi:hypothetical protein